MMWPGMGWQWHRPWTNIIGRQKHRTFICFKRKQEKKAHNNIDFQWEFYITSELQRITKRRFHNVLSEKWNLYNFTQVLFSSNNNIPID